MRLRMTATAALLSLVASPSFATSFIESGDAGETLATAQLVNGDVTSISGTLANLGTVTPVDGDGFAVSRQPSRSRFPLRQGVWQCEPVTSFTQQQQLRCLRHLWRFHLR